MSARVSDCLIALGNLRAAAHACVAVLSGDEAEELGRACDRLSAELSGSGPIRIRYASADETERELASLCSAAVGLAHACRKRRPHDEGAMLVIRRFEAAVCIAQGVLNAKPLAADPISSVHRTSSNPPDPARRTG